jgi:two-component system, LytTR family, sensor kinase
MTNDKSQMENGKWKTSSGLPPRWRNRWLAMAALLTLVGLLFSLNTWLSSQRPPAWSAIFLSQMLPFLTWAALCPAVMWLNQWMPRAWPRIVAFHLAATALFSLLQITLYGLAFWALLALSAPRSLAEIYQAVFPRILLGVVVYKIIVTTNYALDYYEKFRAEQQRAALLEAHLAQAQLQALKTQLQPHFLFNTLNSITSLVLEDQRAAVRMISRLGDFLRLTIENNGTQQVSLERELEFLKCYLEIQQVRFHDRLRVTMQIEPAALSVQVPNLILQPLVENAIKHGIAPRADAGHIGIRARLTQDTLQVEVSNDGPPQTLNGNSARPGVGLANTRERLRQLYQERFQLDLQTRAEGGAVCTLALPLTEGGSHA